MARPSKPWFRESKNTWYCTHDGKKVSLKVRGRENEKEAIQAWHRLFAGMPLESHKNRQESPIVPRAVPTVAVALLREQKAKYGEGRLFRNRHGKPWTGNALVKAMIATRKKAGLEKTFCYGYRHGFATSALVNGVPDAQVAALLGHSGTAILHRHYSHLTAQSQALREALSRVRA